MDTEDRQEASQRFNEMLRNKLEADRTIKLEDLMGRGPEEREADAAAEEEHES